MFCGIKDTFFIGCTYIEILISIVDTYSMWVIINYSYIITHFFCSDNSRKLLNGCSHYHYIFHLSIFLIVTKDSAASMQH